MSQEVWAAVDSYFVEQLVPQDEDLIAALRASDEGMLPNINVAPNQGKLLNLLVKIHGTKRILEIGTLGAYSTLWMAKALPSDGHIVTMEFDPHHADVARANIAHAGFEKMIEVRVGAALDSLAELEKESPEPFDLVFIDADKSNNPYYFKWALKLTKPGSLIIIDNVVRNGAVVDANTEDPNVIGVREALTLVGSEPTVEATAIQTVGSKGYDGLAVILVK